MSALTDDVQFLNKMNILKLERRVWAGHVALRNRNRNATLYPENWKIK
jgi:hypothetical protein